MTEPARFTASFSKLDEERRRASGWAYMVKSADGVQVVDHSGEFVEDVEALEDAVAEYVLTSRDGDEMHTETVVAKLVGSLVVTPEKLAAMGAPDAALPTGWWVEFEVQNDETWKRVKSGELGMFSIQGLGDKEPVHA
jgi:hypothetical protein